MDPSCMISIAYLFSFPFSADVFSGEKKMGTEFPVFLHGSIIAVFRLSWIRAIISIRWSKGLPLTTRRSLFVFIRRTGGIAERTNDHVMWLILAQSRSPWTDQFAPCQSVRKKPTKDRELSSRFFVWPHNHSLPHLCILCYNKNQMKQRLRLQWGRTSLSL